MTKVRTFRKTAAPVKTNKKEEDLILKAKGVYFSNLKKINMLFKQIKGRTNA